MAGFLEEGDWVCVRAESWGQTSQKTCQEVSPGLAGSEVSGGKATGGGRGSERPLGQGAAGHNLIPA